MILERVQNLLQALDDQGQADHDDEWPDLVGEQMQSLEAAYKQLIDPQRTPIDYSELSTQAAYVFRYVLARAEFTYEILKRARAAAESPLFSRSQLWVTSIGGGPGSELLGLLKYLSEEPSEPDIREIVYTIIDKENNWEHVVDHLLQQITDIKIDFFFFPFDVSVAGRPENTSLHREDLVIMSFFVSEVCALPERDVVRSNVEGLLETMPAGSLLLYNDSKAKSFIDFIKVG